MKVLKFGGGCLRDAACFERAAALAADGVPRPAVVVSAVQGVTDLLLNAVSAAASLKSADSAFGPALRDRHVLIAEEALKSRPFRSAAVRTIEAICGRADRLLQGIALVGEASPAVRAQVLSCGERLAAHLFAAVLEDLGLPVRVYETDLIGLAADGGHEDAGIDGTASGPALLALRRDIDAGGFVAVFTGFFGRAPDGRVATFGRNGSDYSAAAIARGLGAEALEFWKDADGFMTADPRWVPEARPIRRLSPAAAAELSYFGSRILHPRVFEPLEGTAIAVRIRNFAAPERPGTEIKAGADMGRPALLSATANAEVAILRILGPGVGARPGVLGLAGSLLARAGVNILTALTAQTAINLLVDRDDVETGRQALSGLGEETVRSIEVLDDTALVAVVGSGFERTPGLAGRFCAALERSGINALLVAGGASPSAVYGVVRRAEARTAVRALHGEFFPIRDSGGLAAPRRVDLPEAAVL